MPSNFKSFAQLIKEGYKHIIKVQSLWSGYGNIYRLTHDNGKSVIVKHINPSKNQEHPRKWDSALAHQRKLKSYQIEYHWYQNYQTLTTDNCKTAKLLYAESQREEQILVLEDLANAGFPTLKSSISIPTVKIVLTWLAQFHGTFIGSSTKGLWETGTYWHLDTRPDEYAAMEQSELKKHAFLINQKLNQCKYSTIVHGDAKLANFCFSKDLSSAAAVDFQYVGGGCGIKDLAYFLGSCLSDAELHETEQELLNHYFDNLKLAMNNDADFELLKTEWTSLYPFAWADFERFLLGWAPEHKKMTGYSKLMTERAINML